MILAFGCKQAVPETSDVSSTTQVGSKTVDLTTYKAANAAVYAGMKKEMKANGFNYDSLATSLKSIKLKGSVSKEEGVALRLYTSAAYSKINTMLRTKKGAQIASIANIVLATSSGLNKLPAKTCTVRRGLDLPAAIVEKIKKIKRFEEDAFMSTTSATSIPAAFQKNITFVIKSTKCRDISFLSEYPGEKEILFPPGSEFIVTKDAVKKKGSVYAGTFNLTHVASSAGFKEVKSGSKQNIVTIVTGADKNDYPPLSTAKKKKPATKTATKLALVGPAGPVEDLSETYDYDPMTVDWDVDGEVPDTVETAVDFSDVPADDFLMPIH